MKMGMVKGIDVRPFPHSVEPALLFDLEISSARWAELVVDVGGLLLSGGKVIAKLDRLERLDQAKGWLEIGELAARGSIFDKHFREKLQKRILLLATLSREALEYIEDIRGKHPKRDVELELILYFDVLSSKSLLAHFYARSPKEYGLEAKNQEALITFKYSPDFKSAQNNLWALSGDGRPVFLSMMRFVESKKWRIASSDWAQEYSPKLGIGKFMIVEILQPIPVTVKEKLAKRVNEANKALRNMEEKLREGEWTEVAEKARPVMELLREEALVKKLLIDAKFPEEATNALLNGIKGFFDFSSKFLHKLTRPKGRQKKRKLLPEVKAEKEDAYFIYMLSAGLINLIGRKIAKLYG